MTMIDEQLVRAHLDLRLGEARAQRRSRQLTTAARMSRRAQQAAEQARAALARI
jgi:hypothetical protein